MRFVSGIHERLRTNNVALTFDLRGGHKGRKRSKRTEQIENQLRTSRERAFHL